MRGVFIFLRPIKVDRKNVYVIFIFIMTEKVQSAERGKYAFWKAFPWAIGIFVATLIVSYGSIWLADKVGWRNFIVSATYPGTVLVVAVLFLQQLIDSAKQRFAEDQSACGVLNSAFRLISRRAKREDEILQTLGRLADGLYFFLRKEKELGDIIKILDILDEKIDSAKEKLSPEMRLELLGQITKIYEALGGISRRRRYPILRSRYVNNKLLAYMGVLFLSLSVATSETNPLIGQTAVFIFTYGLTTAFFYVKHMEFGIGYNPGNVRPDWSRDGWLAEIKAARLSNKI